MQHVAGHVADAAVAPFVLGALVEQFAADLEVVRTGPAVLEDAERGECLIAAAVGPPAVLVAAADDVGVEVLEGGRVAVPAVRPVVTELSAAHLEEHFVGDDAVPLTLVGVSPVLLDQRRVGAIVNRRGRPDEIRVETVGLIFLPPHSVADQFVVLVQRVGGFGGHVLQAGLERLDRKVRQHRLDVLLAQRCVPPHLVFLHEAAKVAVEVVVLEHAIQFGRRQARAAFQAGRDLRGVDVGRLDVRAFVVAVQPAVVGVAAGFRDELRDDAGPRHFGARRAGADRDFVERAVVVVEAGGVGAFGIDDALDHRAVLVGLRVVGRVSRLRPGAAAADIDARQLHGGGLRHDRPEVARVGQRLELFGFEDRGGSRRGDVDDRRGAADRHRFLQRCNFQLDVDRRGEADADVDAFADDRAKPAQLVLDRVDAGRQARKPVRALLITDRRPRALERGGGGRHRDAGQHAAARVCDAAVQRSGRGADRLRCCASGRESQQDQ